MLAGGAPARPPSPAPFPRARDPAMELPSIAIDLPPWVHDTVDWSRVYATDEERMELAVLLSRRNVEHGTGGPFGAAIFETATGKLVSVGVNSVVRLNNCTLHGEMVAFMMAQARLGCFSLGGRDRPAHELATSCEPCAMCLGATLWSGVRRVICGATRDDAARLNFDEGPVFPASYRYLQDRGLDMRFGVLRDRAREVLEMYRAGAGVVYNG
jgi:tRNA(Arg) A34 adenosine deaminase TadA